MADPDKILRKRFKNGDSYMQVVGYIDRPAVVLRDVKTGEKSTIVVWSSLYNALEEIRDQDALEIAEHALMERQSN